MEESKIQFKLSGNGTKVEYEIDSYLDIYELLEHFKAFCLAVGFHEATVYAGFKELLGRFEDED